MSRFTIPVCLLALAATPCMAQPLTLPRIEPGRETPGRLPATVTDNHLHFSTDSVELRQNGGRWQLWAGTTFIKDFADSRENAYEARRLIADMKLTEYATIGTPEPVMEYWLASGEAPFPPMSTRQVLPFDAGNLKIDRMNENYVIHDGRQILYNFGPYAADAKQAMAVIQKYHFNELGLVGMPRPSMTYLVRADRVRLGFGSADMSLKPKLVPQQTPRYPLILPGLGNVGERTPFDPMRVEMTKSADGWHLVAGPHDLARLGTSEYNSREALHAIQRFPMNELVHLGTSGFAFFLCRSQAPRGVPLGMHHVNYDMRTLTVRPEGDHLAITDGKHVLTTFPAGEEREAKTALAVVKYYGFDAQCDVGGLSFLVRDH